MSCFRTNQTHALTTALWMLSGCAPDATTDMQMDADLVGWAPPVAVGAQALSKTGRPPSTSSRFYLTVKPTGGFVYINVNDVRRQVLSQRGIDTDDVSDWFVAGANQLRIQALNATGAASYAVTFEVDGHKLIEESCACAPCDGTAPHAGIALDRSYTVSVQGRPPAGRLQVTGTAGGRIYLDDAYTGKKVPTTFVLPAGAYTVGVGVGEGSSDAYAGRYYEQRVTLAGAELTVTPTAAAPIANPNVTRLAILPVRYTHHGSDARQDTGVLAQTDIDTLASQARATSRSWVLPFSYGLTRWEISVLPTLEDPPLSRDADPEKAPDTERLLREAGLSDLTQRFDSIVYLYSELTADGAPVRHQPCCFWGGGHMVAFQNGLLRGAEPDAPNVYLLHEMLHDYESFNASKLGYYNGISGAHGAQTHGYARGAGGEPDFLKFYRAFMRGQVAEVAAMREDVPWTQARPDAPDLWVGLFDTMRSGMAW